MIEWILITIIMVAILFMLAGIRIIRPTQRGLVETLGKYSGFRTPGFNYIIPILQRMITVNVTENMTDIEPQEIITKDNLNAQVDLVVYFKIKSDERNVYNSEYQVNNVYSQLDTLARTTARNVIGTMMFKDVNGKRNELNAKLKIILVKETANWGVDVLKVEMKEIVPPKDVQETMNKVIKAENEKDAAIDFATARETEADGKKRAAIKEAEGLAQGKIIVANAEAKRIQVVNDAANKHFKGNAQLLRKLDVTEASLKDNAKIILTEKGINTNLLIGELPLSRRSTEA
jgi:regulator of protease activity HflC (stomatin/prohibitin superfamily)